MIKPTIQNHQQNLSSDDDKRMVELGRAVLEIEAGAITDLIPRIGAAFVTGAKHMLACTGRIVVIGMGKSGHIASKIAATLASTGTPAFFVHPGEASHGDMGMITAQDVVLAISNSGETNELIILLPLIKRLGIPLVALTGKPGSTIAQAATVHLNVGVSTEACPLGLAPTSSTAAALAMGDALAIALLETRGFTREDFAHAHPGGALGRRLLLKIVDLIHTGSDMPAVGPDTPTTMALVEMTEKGLGVTAVVDQQRRVLGVFTDGDLRRVIDRELDLHKTPIGEVMTAECTTIEIDTLAAEALAIMQDKRINALLVVDSENILQGVLNMHDMLKAGVV